MCCVLLEIVWLGLFVTLISIFARVFCLMIRRPPRATLDRSSAASDVYKRQVREVVLEAGQDPSAYQGWANCCHALAEDHPSTMGTTALRRALEDAKVEPAELKLVLFAGMSRDYLPSWSVATEIMKACGTGGHCMGLDMTAGCLGALSALCLLYTSDAADERSSVDLGGRRIIKNTRQCILTPILN